MKASSDRRRPRARLGESALRAIVLVLAAGVLLSSCARSGQEGGPGQTGEGSRADLRGTVTADGSSTVFPITEAMAEEFGKENPNVRVTVGISGTGGGFKKFCNGETDISNASRPIKNEEIEACKSKNIEYVELAVGYDGLSVLVNKENSWVDKVTVEELKKIWEPAAQGKITRWNQVRPDWPDQPLTLYGPGTDSGTFDYFTEAIMGKTGDSRGDYTASEDDNVLVQGIAGDKNALGYFGFAYYEENADKLKLVPVLNPRTGKAVLPSEQTIRSGEYYPLSRPLFIYVRKESASRPEVRAFVEFYLSRPDLVRSTGYVALSDELQSRMKNRFASGVTGTAYASEEQKLSGKLEDIYK